MRNFVLLSLLTISTSLFANNVNINTSLLIEQEEGEINITDAAGKKQGQWIYYGSMVPEKGYPEKGKIEEGPYMDNRKNGQWTKYFKDGMTPKLVGVYANGRPKGAFTKFHENGKVKMEGTYVSGKHKGPLNSFYADGTPSQEKNFNEAGKEEGKQKIFYANGQVEVEYETKNGVKTGKKIKYTESGEVKEITTYGAQGEIVNKEEKDVVEVVKTVVGGTGVSGASSGNVKEGTFKPNAYNKVYNTDDELWMDGKFKSGKLWDGKLYKYDSDGILLKIEIWKDGKYHSDGQL